MATPKDSPSVEPGRHSPAHHGHHAGHKSRGVDLTLARFRQRGAIAASKHILRDGVSAPKLLSAGRATSPSKRFFRDGASPPELLCAGRATSPSKHFSGIDRHPRNYFLQDVPHLRANAFSGMERHPRNYFVQDVPHLRANTFSGMDRHPQNYFLQDVPHLRANFSQGWCVTRATTGTRCAMVTSWHRPRRHGHFCRQPTRRAWTRATSPSTPKPATCSMYLSSL